MNVLPLREAYEDGVCPDCYTEIPLTATEGVSCLHCGHVFWLPTVSDDE